ncbi:hypothetical protein VTK26DRAFT_8954 [Humicola hyalothermophila]
MQLPLVFPQLACTGCAVGPEPQPSLRCGGPGQVCFRPGPDVHFQWLSSILLGQLFAPHNWPVRDAVHISVAVPEHIRAAHYLKLSGPVFACFCLPLPAIEFDHALWFWFRARNSPNGQKHRYGLALSMSAKASLNQEAIVVMRDHINKPARCPDDRR